MVRKSSDGIERKWTKDSTWDVIGGIATLIFQRANPDGTPVEGDHDTRIRRFCHVLAQIGLPVTKRGTVELDERGIHLVDWHMGDGTPDVAPSPQKWAVYRSHGGDDNSNEMWLTDTGVGGTFSPNVDDAQWFGSWQEACATLVATEMIEDWQDDRDSMGLAGFHILRVK